MWTRLYVYKEDDIFQEKLYHKKCLMSFINDLSYFNGGVHLEETDRKHLKCLIDSLLMMKPYTSEERKIIFGKSWKLLASLLYLLTLGVFTLVIIAWRLNQERSSASTFKVGIWPGGTITDPSTTLEPYWSVATLNALQRPCSVSNLLALLLLMGSGPWSFKECRVHPSQEDCLYLANMFECAL